MPPEKLTRTVYVDPGNGLPRSGSTARSESRVDLEQYLDPSLRLHAGHAHGRGVLAGLEVTAARDRPGLRVHPGVALDGLGRHISLAAGGLARVGPEDPVPVADDGVELSTAGATGPFLVTIGHAETFDETTFANSQFTVFQTDHTPRLELREPASVPADGSLVVLARAELDADGAVVALAEEHRAAAGVPGGELDLRRATGRADGDSLSVGDVPAATLRPRAGGGVELRVSAPGDEVALTGQGGRFATLTIDADRVVAHGPGGAAALTVDALAGNVGVGGVTPRTALHLPDRGLQIGAGPAQDNFHLVCDAREDRRGLRLYRGDHGAGTHLLSVLTTGAVGVNQPAPLGRLHVRDGGGFGPEDADGKLRSSAVPLLAQANSTAFGLLNGDGRPAFALNINDNAGTADARGVPTLYDRFDGRWHAAIRLRNGRVGMGTAAPESTLHVVAGAADRPAVLAVSDRKVTTLRARNTGTGAAVGGEADSGFGVSGQSDTGNGVCGQSRTQNGVTGVTREGVGVVGVGAQAGNFLGSVHVQGTLSKSSGQFRIDHPLRPAEQYLNHSFVESAEMKNVYDGVVVLGAHGAAEIAMPDWCDALNTAFRYQLTPVGAPAPGLHVAEELRGNRFTVAGGEPGLQVCWQVTGVRRDPYALANPIAVEEDKPDVERGHYLHPEVYGLPDRRSIAWARQPRAMRLLQVQLARMDAAGRRAAAGSPTPDEEERAWVRRS